jgi:ubiquinone/menaquinone biosynthesis C-methylase UbiE
MAEHVCPWWLGYFLAGPIRRWMSEDPEEMLSPYVRPGMKVLEPGPGMGFFTLPLAHMVGPNGRVIAVDIQPRMLKGLRSRAEKRNLADRIETRLAAKGGLGLDDLSGTIDFALVFAVVHETPSVEAFFRDIAAALKPGSQVLFAEPAGHVKAATFQQELDAARAAGLETTSRPAIRRSSAAVLKKIGEL